ncbi:MAG: Uma2 family endonuclease [Candidatus Magnetoovum sp. WYHC-5]|nr:Uma2 family endonuclease [Candidatus Magnetoovum sp. WYHC-5]
MNTQTFVREIEQLIPPIPLESDFDLTEIINGVEIMSPSPFSRHQKIITNLSYIIISYIRKNKLGELFISPLDVILEKNLNRLQPDLLFIKKENTAIVQDWVRGVPDMVCEIVSKGSYRKDTETKRDIYERYKVPEFWIVIPELEIIKILTLKDDKYTVFSYAEIEGVVTSKVIEGLQVDIKSVFEDNTVRHEF